MTPTSDEDNTSFLRRIKMPLWKYTHLTKILLVLTFFILVVTIKLFESVSEEEVNHPKAKRWSGLIQPESTAISSTIQPNKQFLRVFHIDLKGAPPKMSYLMNLLPVVRTSGANAVLIEYEDMFPFSGKLRNVSATNAYSLAEIEEFIELAEALEMEVIPLVQTFGHLEYVLKLEEFRHMRELDSFPQEICPSSKDAVEMIKEMVRQVMATHRNARYLHIGCDEVRHLSACYLCSRTRSKKLFSKHVTKIGNFVRDSFPGVIPLIWDDMLRRWTFDDMANSGLGSVVEPVIWVYGNNIFTLVPRHVWNIYQRIFPKLWVASSFKGAFGETEILPRLTLHLENQVTWLAVLRQQDDEILIPPEVFSGIFVTGWSRYDHFAVLCELLPVGVPSLVLSMLSLQSKLPKDKMLEEWLRILRCPSDLDAFSAEREMYFQYKLGNCSFPGSNVYSGVAQFEQLRTRLREMRRKIDDSGWVSGYNVRKNFTSPWRVIEMFPEEGFGGEILKREVVKVKKALLTVMQQYYDNYTVAEWEEQNIKPVEERLREVQKDFQGLIERKAWPRRPLR